MADAGYERLDNYLYLDSTGQTWLIKRITSRRGIHLRLYRSIQVEGAFALMKNDFGFRRFLTHGKASFWAELFLLAIAFDLKELWMMREHGRLQTRISEKKTV